MATSSLHYKDLFQRYSLFSNRVCKHADPYPTLVTFSTLQGERDQWFIVLLLSVNSSMLLAFE